MKSVWTTSTDSCWHGWESVQVRKNIIDNCLVNCSTSHKHFLFRDNQGLISHKHFSITAAAPGYTKFITVVSGTIAHLYKILIKRDNERCKIRVELPMGRICTLPDRQLTSLTVWVICRPNITMNKNCELPTVSKFTSWKKNIYLTIFTKKKTETEKAFSAWPWDRHILGLFKTFETFWDFRDCLRFLRTFWDFWDFLRL